MKKPDFSFIKNVKKTWTYIKDCKSNLIGYGMVSIVEGIIGVILPIYSAKIILNITSGVMEQLLVSAFFVFGIDIILYTMNYLKGLLFQKIYQATLIRLQVAVARETLKLEVKEIDQASSGLFIDRLNRDTQDISSMFMEYTYWISYVISNIGVLIAIVILNRYLFLYSVIISLILFFINKVRLKKQYEIQRNLKKLQEKKTGLTSELVRGIRDIKVLNASDAILKKTSDKITETSNEEVKMLNIRRGYQYLENNARAISDFIFLLLGCFLYKNQLLTIPVFVIIYNYQSKVKNLLLGIVQLLEYNKKFVVASERVFEIIGNEKFKKERFGTKHVKKMTGFIQFDKVQFGYNEDSPIINQMSFEIAPNETVAFVGKSGAGKTTVFQLLSHLYTTNFGKISLDGIDINELDEESIRNNMSIITQNPYIFNFSIKDNLLLAKEDATMEEIRESCKMACIDEFIMSLPNQYDTMIGENGMVLSGGQRQRLAIARALLLKTEIILFDEATSALDNETQSQIQEAIQNMKGEYTILIIAHRLSTIVHSNKIIVIEDGTVKAVGTHKELLQSCEFYRTLYDKDIQTVLG